MQNALVIQPPNEAENIAIKGLLCQQEGKLEEAAFYYQRALDYNPNLQPVHYNLGIVLHQQGDLLGAYQSYKQAIALEPDDVNAYYNLGIVLQHQGLLKAAIDSYQQAINLSKTNDSNDLDSVVNAYSNWGCILLQQGQTDAAISVFKKALVLKPNDFTIHNNIGQALLQKRKLDAAIATFETTLKLEPQFAIAYHNIGKAYQYRGLHQEAVKYFQQVIELEPENLTAYTECGYSLMEQGKLTEAVAYLQIAINNNPFVAGYCKWAGLLAESTDELDKAKVACAQFLTAIQKYNYQGLSSLAEITQPLVETYLHLGNVSAEYGRHNQAEFYYKTALNIQPLAAEYYVKLGKSLIQQHRINSAIIIDRLGLAIYPDHPEISAHLQSISTETKAHQQQKPLQSSCQGLNCQPCLQRIFKQFNPIHLGNRIYRCSKNQITASIRDKNNSLKISEPATFVAKFPEGRAWVVPQKNAWMICNAIAIINRDNQLIKELSREYPGQLPGCQKYDINQHRIFASTELPPLTEIDGTVAVLSGLSGNVYFHWMVDILPRLEILKIHGIDLAEIDWFLVNNYQQPFQRESLNILGIPEEKIIASDRHPHIQAKNLIVPSFPGYLGWLPSWALEFHRRVFLNRINQESPTEIQPIKFYPERIYISRNNSRYRRVFNEEEVISKLSQQGFVCIHPESMTLTEQIAIFAHAKVIIAAHGSGLTNIMFCRPGTKVIELVSPNYIRHYYWAISQQLGLEHYYLKGEDFTCYPIRQLMYQNPLTEDIIVNLNSLEKIMKITGLVENSQIREKVFKGEIKPSIQNYPPVTIRENSSAQNSPPVIKDPAEKKMSLTVNSLEAAAQLHKQAEIHLKQKELTAAKTACEQALKYQPDHAPSCKTLGNIFHAQGQLEPAWYWYTKAIELQPNFAEAYTNLGTLYAQKAEWQEAIAYYEKAIEIQPDLAAAYRNLARAYDKIGNHKEAAQCRKQAYSLEPANPEINQHQAPKSTSESSNEPTPIAIPNDTTAAYKLLGKMLQSQGQIEAAWQSYKKAISFYPNDPENYLHIGTLYAQQQQWVEAIQCYKKAIALNQNYTDAYRNLATAWTKIGKQAEASNCWYLAYTLEPEKATAEEHMILGNTLLQQNVIDQAISCYCRAIELNPNLLGAYENLGEALKLQGTKKPTAKVFPNHWQNQANSFSLIGAAPGTIQQTQTENQIQIVQQLKNFERVVTDLVSTVTSAFNLKNDLSENYLESSLSLLENSQIQIANSQATPEISYPKKALALEPDLTNIYWNLEAEKSVIYPTKTHDSQIIHSNFKQTKNSQPVLPPNQAVTISEVYIQQAQNYYERGLYEQTISQCQQAISIKPDALTAYILLGNSQQKIGQIKAAEKNYQRAIEINPKNASLHTHLGNLYAAEKSWQSAISCYQKAAAIQPNVAENYRHLAQAWTQLGQAKTAADCWYQAYSLEPQKVTANEHFNLGNTLYKQGQITQAVSCYHHTIKLNPNFPTAYYNLSVALKRLGRLDEAVIYYRKAKQIWGESVDTQIPRQEENQTTYLSTQNQTQPRTNLTENSAPKVDIPQQNGRQANAPEINPESLKPQQLNKIEQNGQNTTQKDQLQETLKKAEAYYLEGLFTEAIATCEAAINIKPEPEAYQIMGQAFQSTNQIDNALKSYRQALKINPNLAGVNYGIGQIFAEQKNWHEAISYYRQALHLLQLNLDAQKSIGLKPDIWEVYQQLGDALQEIGEIEEAAQVYRQALDLTES